jgi:hypothetical protein
MQDARLRLWPSWTYVPGSPALPPMVPCSRTHDVRTVHELKTRVHAVIACATCPEDVVAWHMPHLTHD